MLSLRWKSTSMACNYSIPKFLLQYVSDDKFIIPHGNLEKLTNIDATSDGQTKFYNWNWKIYKTRKQCAAMLANRRMFTGCWLGPIVIVDICTNQKLSKVNLIKIILNDKFKPEKNDRSCTLKWNSLAWESWVLVHQRFWGTNIYCWY